MRRRVILYSLGVWLLLLCGAIGNGALREFVLRSWLPNNWAYVASVFTLCAIVVGVTYVFLRLVRVVYTFRDLIGVGVMWVLLTVAFEFPFGRYVAGKSWQELLADYNPLVGGLFLVVLATTLLAPIVLGSLIKGHSVLTMTNDWNRFIYGLWSPIYDRLVNVLFLASARRRAIEMVDMQPGEHALLVGVGTGADLPLLPKGISAVGIDLSPAMLKKAQAKLPLDGREITLVEGDVQSMPFDDDTFDVAILTLILSVVPDGSACLQETMRVLRPGGRALIFDKFVRHGERPSFGRRLLNLLTSSFGTDINREFEEMLAKIASVVVASDEPALLNGAYRTILLRSLPNTSGNLSSTEKHILASD